MEDNFSSDFESPLGSEGIISSETKLPVISDFSRLEKLPYEGSTCEAYKWERSARVYFVKRLKHQFLGSPQHICAFEKEYELGSRLNHPSLPRYVDYKRTENERYIVMEYIDGTTLNELWHKQVTADRKITYKIMHQLIDVLEYLHSNNIMHYDLIPQNVMLTNGLNNIVLLDLDKSFNSAFTKTSGDTSRFGLDKNDKASPEVDFRAISMILTRGFWGGMDLGELKYFNDLCNKPGVTAEELREALDNKYEDLYINDKVYYNGRTCEAFEGDWQLSPVFIKKLKPNLLKNQFYREKFLNEFRIMSDVENPIFAFYLLIKETPDDYFIVIQQPLGMTLSRMISEKHPWLYKWQNIKFLIQEMWDVFFYLWTEGLDNMCFESEDIFIDTVNDVISVVNLRNILDTTKNDENRFTTTGAVKTVSCETQKVLHENRIPTPDPTLYLEMHQLCHIINQLKAANIDVEWLSDFYISCSYGASYRDLYHSLMNARP